MKIDSVLGKICLSMAQIATGEDPIKNEQDRKNKVLRTKAAWAAVVSQSTLDKKEMALMNNKLQYDRIEERKSRGVR